VYHGPIRHKYLTYSPFPCPWVFDWVLILYLYPSTRGSLWALACKGGIDGVLIPYVRVRVRGGACVRALGGVGVATWSFL
jgi:hypothetical protein